MGAAGSGRHRKVRNALTATDALGDGVGVTLGLGVLLVGDEPVERKLTAAATPTTTTTAAATARAR
jgi:hypothetical protein